MAIWLHTCGDMLLMLQGNERAWSEKDFTMCKGQDKTMPENRHSNGLVSGSIQYSTCWGAILIKSYSIVSPTSITHFLSLYVWTVTCQQLINHIAYISGTSKRVGQVKYPVKETYFEKPFNYLKLNDVELLQGKCDKSKYMFMHSTILCTLCSIYLASVLWVNTDLIWTPLFLLITMLK